jgi:hypothetical protein
MQIVRFRQIVVEKLVDALRDWAAAAAAKSLGRPGERVERHSAGPL